MKSVFITVCVVALCVSGVVGDLYMHNPRGSNDRNCERNVNRNNGNRLFDSQNNDKGGYACPRSVSNVELPADKSMYYYEGSKLMLEWTNQHGCGPQDNTNCQIVVQYMCEDQNPELRDGTPETLDDAATDRMDAGDVNNRRYGYHETYPYYQRCNTRDRNRGLYAADQQINRNDATGTRQNNNGARRGWECPEERDYYPYWHPAPWKDVAILTSDFSGSESDFPGCSWFQRNSQNVRETGHCFTSESEGILTDPDAPINVMDDPDVTPLRYNTEPECLSEGGFWYWAPKLGGGQPECKTMNWQRDNHLGSDLTGYMVNYIWTIPNIVKGSDEGTKCTLRMRYNISTADVPYWLDHTVNNNNDEDLFTGPNGDPYVQPFAPFSGDNIDKSELVGAYNLSMALNTNQYGRTFQDRSYVFYIRSRGSKMETPKSASSGEIWNLNVRGKRGNIVQTYPSLEYDFVPQWLEVEEGTQIHIQWTGSDYNPDRQPNNGEGGPQDLANQGTYRADRHNMVQLAGNDASRNIPRDYDAKSKDTKEGPVGYSDGAQFFNAKEAARMAYINQDIENDCDHYELLLANNNNNQDEADKDSRNCYKLNAAEHPYFDGGIVKASKVGTFHFMSSRNNNFTNRSQKGTIVVRKAGLSKGEAAGVAVASVAAVGAAAGGGGYYYAKQNPGSAVAQKMNGIMGMFSR